MEGFIPWELPGRELARIPCVRPASMRSSALLHCPSNCSHLAACTELWMPQHKPSEVLNWDSDRKGSPKWIRHAQDVTQTCWKQASMASAW